MAEEDIPGAKPEDSQKNPTRYRQAVQDFLALPEGDRRSRLALGLGKKDFIPDEVVATLMLVSWREGWPDGDLYAQHLIWRLARHVRAHVRRNPGWQQRGGGPEATTSDFCSDIHLAMLKDKAQPCHAEVAFGNYVWLRCLDCADELFAKKRNASKSLDEPGVEADAHYGDDADLLAEHQKSPEELLEWFENLEMEKALLERIQTLAQTELPDNERIAFTYRFYGSLPIFSKDAGKLTVAKLMGIGERSARQYVANAIGIIKEKLQ